MILYRITRYGKDGRVKWVKYKETKHSFGATKGDIRSGYMRDRSDRVTLELLEVFDENVHMVEDFKGVPEVDN